MVTGRQMKRVRWSMGSCLDAELVSGHGSATKLSLHGELDISGVAAVHQELARLAGGDSRDVILDLSGLEFIDSTGLSCLIEANDIARAKGLSLSIVPGEEEVARVLRLTGLDRILPLVPPNPGPTEAAPVPPSAEAVQTPEAPAPASSL